MNAQELLRRIGNAIAGLRVGAAVLDGGQRDRRFESGEFATRENDSIWSIMDER